MALNDYLLQQDGIDWNRALQTWHWLLPGEFTLWMVNRFCDLFIVLEDGSVNMLDVSGGSLEKLAESLEEFTEKIDLDDNADLWLMIPLVDEIFNAGIHLKQGECYGFSMPTIVGGEYVLSNVAVFLICGYLAGCGKLHDQLKNVPDGEQVVITTDFGDASRN